MLALANVSLAAAQFAEPVLFGRIVDALAGAQSRGGVPVWTDVMTLLAAWVSFGLFTITCGALVALHADRLAHRRRHAVMTDYFEHILQLPLSFHGGIHSGRLMKVMLTGTGFAVVAVARILPRAYGRVRFAAGAAAAVARPELAAGAAADRALLRVRRPDRAGAAQGRSRAERGRAPLRRSGRARLRCARQRRAGAKLFAHRGRSERLARTSSASCSARRCRCCRGGRSARC